MPRPRSSTCSTCWMPVHPNRLRFSVCRWASSAPPSRKWHWRSPAIPTWSCTDVAVAVRWPCRPSTRSRVRPSERRTRRERARLSMAGTLYGVGLGPGDPELVTVKAVRLIAAADVVAYHSARHGRSVARLIVEPYLRGDQIEEQLVYPVT